MTPLVLGAAGFLGLNLVDALVAEGLKPDCGRRRRTNVLLLRKRKLPMVQADLDDIDALTESMRGYELVYHAAGYYPRLSVDHQSIFETGLSQMRNALDAAAAAGVKRLVYVSSTGTVAPSADGSPSTEEHVFPLAPGFGPYHDLKWQMEALALAEDRLEVLVACPSACLGPFDLRVGTSALLVGMARAMDPPHPDGVVNLVDVRDVGTAVARMGLHPSPPKRLLINGDNQPLHAMLVDLADRYQVPAPSAPLSAAEAIALADAEEARCAIEGGRPAISREIVDLIVHGVPLDASLAQRTLNLSWRPLSQTLDDYDAWARPLRIIPTPSEALESRP